MYRWVVEMFECPSNRRAYSIRFSRQIFVPWSPARMNPSQMPAFPPPRHPGYNALMSVRSIILSIAALVCFAAAYRFGSHGLTLQDNWCVGLACSAFAVAVLLLWFAFRNRKRP
jgi:hypothetical protein